jgi:dolichol-phosphate mannosyltransferase
MRRLDHVLADLTDDLEIPSSTTAAAMADVLIRPARAGCAVKLIRLSRNFGHQAALNGLTRARRCRGHDGRRPPGPTEVLADFVRAWRDGAEVVYGIREHRQGNVAKRAGYRTFYRVYRRLADIDVPLDSGDFCLMERQVVDAIATRPSERFLEACAAGWLRAVGALRPS